MQLPQPDLLIGRILFRALLAIFARRDRLHGSIGIGGRLARVRAAWRFVRGSGAVPRVNPFLPETTFEAVERDSGTPMEIEETLERYYVVKLTSLQFCGPPNFGLPFWAGLESLILTLPMIQWLRRAFADVPAVQSTQQAIQIVDDHFGGDPMLGFGYVRFLQGLIAQHGELEKLVAWYSR
jgi:lysine-N-methylase